MGPRDPRNFPDMDIHSDAKHEACLRRCICLLTFDIIVWMFHSEHHLNEYGREQASQATIAIEPDESAYSGSSYAANKFAV